MSGITGGAAASAVEFLESITLSGNVTEEFAAIPEAGYIHIIDVINLKFATDDQIFFRYGTGGGPTFLTTGYEGTRLNAFSTTVSATVSVTTANLLSDSGGGSAALEVVSGVIEIWNAAEAIATHLISRFVYENAAGVEGMALSGGRQSSAVAVTGFQLSGQNSVAMDTGKLILSRRKVF